jgi:hypothetical protein
MNAVERLHIPTAAASRQDCEVDAASRLNVRANHSREDAPKVLAELIMTFATAGGDWSNNRIGSRRSLIAPTDN